MKKYDIIAFDLDGTLSDPSRGFVLGCKYAFSKMGMECEDDESFIASTMRRSSRPVYARAARRRIIFLRNAAPRCKLSVSRRARITEHA